MASIREGDLSDIISFKYPTNQIAFCTEKAIHTLSFEGSYEI